MGMYEVERKYCGGGMFHDDEMEQYHNVLTKKVGIVNDLPDVIVLGGPRYDTWEWLRDGYHHRDGDKPAYVRTDGLGNFSFAWYRNGTIHRVGGPAVVEMTGTTTKEYWYRNGVLHRDDGFPAVVGTDGAYEYWVGGVCHRLDGSAQFVPDRFEKWFVNGVLHREDGPAVINYLGRGRVMKAWFVNGVFHNRVKEGF